MGKDRIVVELDENARDAAQALAARYGCSVTEAVGRAVLQQRDALFRDRPDLTQLIEEFRNTHDLEELDIESAMRDVRDPTRGSRNQR